MTEEEHISANKEMAGIARRMADALIKMAKTRAQDDYKEYALLCTELCERRKKEYEDESG
jgi:hypothetical protein